MKKVVGIIALIILLPVLFVNIVIIANSYMNPDKVPSFFGWKPFIVLSGSMETEIMTGDLVVVKETDTSTLKKDDIIAFKEEDIVITHRIADIIKENGETKYITKGDNNNAEDQGYVKPSQIEGLFQFKVSRLGNLAMFIQTPVGMVVSLSIPIMMLILIQVADSKKNQEEMSNELRKQKAMEDEIKRLKKQNDELQGK